MTNKMRTNVQEIFKILNLPDVFRRLEMNTEELKPIEHLLTPFLGACQNNSPTLGELIRELATQIEYAAIFLKGESEWNQMTARLLEDAKKLVGKK